jgi:hypothetical protein
LRGAGFANRPASTIASHRIFMVLPDLRVLRVLRG